MNPVNSTTGSLEGTHFLLVTLGCFRNEVESDELRSALKLLGLVETAALERADLVIVNTCGFIREACEEGIDTLLELASCSRELEAPPPVVALGCMGERYENELLDAMPEISCVLGAGWDAELQEALIAVLDGGRYAGGRASSCGWASPRRPRTVDSSDTGTLFVRVADGCDRRCAFCKIPSIRGRYRSRPVAEIRSEVERLVGDGDRELVLLAQDLTSYGKDIGGGCDLVHLVEEVTSIDGVHWLRLLYLQPEGVTEKLIEAVAGNPVVCNYFDIPFQHVSGSVLRAMGRPGDERWCLELVESIRNACPDAALRTTVMVGYPDETQEDFESLLAFVGEARFDWLGAFVYSPEEGTRAAALAGAVDEDRARERYGRILELQDSVEEALLPHQLGRELEVLVEGDAVLDGFELVGRSYREAPVVDGVIYLNPSESPKQQTCISPGDFVRASVTGQEGLDLVGEIRDAK